jgi:flagellar M-ring protein FliF
MEQVKRIFANLTLRQKISLAAAALAAGGLIAGLLHWNKERDFKPVYSNLAPEDAAQVLARLKESGVEYRIGDSGASVLVPSSRVAELRLSLAASGLPKSGRIGFEIFDRTNFGASEFAEQINYHRALEGELERSIMSLAEVERARVHITFPKDSIYTESKQPAKASILLTLRPGAVISPQNVTAICHLTASAVEGLNPEGVSVLDMRGNLLSRPRKAGFSDGSEAALEYRQQIEKELLGKIANTLEPMLGADRFRAGVSVDCDLSSAEQSEETFDPSKSVMLTSQRTEDGAAAASASGVPGTASNLPRPTSRPAAGWGGNSRRTENVTYASSRVVKHTKLPQGAIRRISVSVLLDHSLRFENGKRIIEPPSPDRIKVVRDLVAGVAGLVPERGDQVVVESSPFESTLSAEPPPVPPARPATDSQRWIGDLMANKQFRIIAGVACGLVLVLGAGAALLIARARKRKQASVSVPPALEAAREGAKSIERSSPDNELAQVPAQAALAPKQGEDLLNSLNIPEVSTKKAEVLVKQIKKEAKKDPVAAAQVIRSWLTASE